LKKGDDIRGKGLVWIIETLWDLDHVVDRMQLPEALDEKSKDFILEIAKKDYSLGSLKSEF